MENRANAHDTVAVPHKLLRAYLGAWAMTWDAVVETVQKPETLYARGRTAQAAIVEEAGKWWQGIGKARGSILSATRSAVRAPLVRLEGDLAATSAVAEEELERQVEVALARLGIPTRDRILKLGRDIDALTSRIDKELARLSAEETAFSV